METTVQMKGLDMKNEKRTMRLVGAVATSLAGLLAYGTPLDSNMAYASHCADDYLNGKTFCQSCSKDLPHGLSAV
jgi:hypothetical protein